MRTLRSPLPLPLTPAPFLTGYGSGDDPDTSAGGLPKEIGIGAATAKNGYRAPDDANIAAVGQLVNETNASQADGAEPASAPEAMSHPTVMCPLNYKRNDHLPSGPWYFYEYPDREPKLLKRVKPAYVPGSEQ